MEVAGLAFGVLPVLVNVLQSYATVHETLHTFRHYSSEVKRVKTQLNIQKTAFENCYSQLQILTAGADRVYLATNFRRERYIEEHLNRRIDDTNIAIRGVIENTQDELSGMQKDLDAFSILKREKQQVRRDIQPEISSITKR